MISVYNLKPKFQQLLRPVLERLYRLGVTANGITWAALLLSLATGIVFWFVDNPVVLPLVSLVLLVRMALNALDGMMARTYQMQSRLGEVLNELGDVLSDTFIFFPMIKMAGVQPFWLFAFVLGAVINEFAGLLGKAMGGARQYDGPMGKSDRAFMWGAGCLVLYFFPAAVAGINYVLAGACALLLVSTYTRLRKAIQA